jgi:divalent metal cation (Fe/Co/Zn/Cd) transporter
MTQPVASAALRRRAIGLALAFFLWAAVLIAVVKLLLAQALGSLSLLACALHSLLLCFSALVGLQSLGQPAKRQSEPQSERQVAGRRGHGKPVNLEGGVGLLETLTALLLWALLGFGGFSLLGELWRRGARAWVMQATAGEIALALPWAALHPALLPLLAGLAVLGFVLAFLARLCARHLSHRILAFQSYLLLQDGWLVLIAALGFVALGQGVTMLESIAAVGILAMVMADAWRWLGVHMPHWRNAMAIAPEALVATAQQVDGVLGCQVLSCRGLVGRRMAIALELRLHPEFESLRHRLGRQVERAIERRYGPAQVDIFLVRKLGGPRRRLDLSQEDEVLWVDGTGEE